MQLEAFRLENKAHSLAESYCNGYIQYEEFEKECNRQLTNIAGLGIHDLADASWRDYFEAGMSPRDAIECANDDYWDGELSDILHG